MILHITELRSQLFRVFNMIDAGEDIIIIKKNSNKKYRISSVKAAAKPSIVEVAKQMGSIGIKTMDPGKMKKIFETRYE